MRIELNEYTKFSMTKLSIHPFCTLENLGEVDPKDDRIETNSPTGFLTLRVRIEFTRLRVCVNSYSKPRYIIININLVD